jgi:hypothetical protein
MSSALAKTASLLAKAAVETTWQQWGVIGAQTNTPRPGPQAVVDPEALLLLSLALLQHERRLADVVGSWVTLNSSLLSVQRVRNIASTFPAPVQQQLGAVASLAVHEAKDLRWKSATGDSTSSFTARKTKSRAMAPAYMHTPTLMLQLRQGMGVGVKADIFTYLLTCDNTGQRWASTAAMARMLGYTHAAVRRNADDLAAARFIGRMETVDPDTSASRLYMAEAGRWAGALQLGAIQQGWRDWRARFAFIADVLDTSATLTSHGATEFAEKVACRELIERNRDALMRDTSIDPGLLEVPDDWPGALQQVSERLVEWMRNHP